MSEPLSTYYEYAQLSLAAYGTFSPGQRPQIDVLTSSVVGFSQVLAEEFNQGYTVLSQSDPSVTGFSATLFQRSDGKKILAIRGTEFTVADLATDALMGLFGNSVLNPQYLALKNYVGRLITPVSQNGPGLGLIDVEGGEQFSIAGHSLGGYLGSVLTANSDFGAHVSKVYTYNAPGAGGALAQLLNTLGLLPQNIADAKITNLNADNGLSLIAGLGIQRGAVQDIFIEEGSSVHNHRIVTLTDSLALYNLFGTIAPNIEVESITEILNAAGTSGGSSLESTLFALRRLFQSPPNSLIPNTPLDAQDRDAYYVNIDTVASQLPIGTYSVESLTASPNVASQAEQSVGIAYRYALTQLNPFVIHGADYDRHNTNGELELVNLSAGTGTLTHDYLVDRALFLTEKLALNQQDHATSSGNIHFKDFAPNGLEITTVVDLRVDQEFLFGSDGLDRLEGESNDDHLYGGAEVDLLIGNGGNDYLQGDGGGDQLDGGAGIDRLLGGAGNDLLEGGTENDTLNGGLDNDILKGGSGLDTYRIRALDGSDTIEDSDGKGVVEFDGKVLLGGLRRESDPANVFRSADGTITFTKSGTDLVVTGSGPLTIKNFSSGQFGIRLVEEGSYAAAMRSEFLKIDHYDSTPTGFVPVYAAFFDDNANDTTTTANPGQLVPAISDENNLIYAGGGNDRIVSGSGDDQLYGKGDSDEILWGTWARSIVRRIRGR